MSAPFHQLSVDEFAELVARFDFTRRIDLVHLHHTWRPTHADYVGASTIEAMWRYHTQDNGWTDIAQHVTIAPDGIDLDRPAAGTSRRRARRATTATRTAGPFMFEMIGDFDPARPAPGHAARDARSSVIARVQRALRSAADDALRFHNEMSRQDVSGHALEPGGDPGRGAQGARNARGRPGASRPGPARRAVRVRERPDAGPQCVRPVRRQRDDPAAPSRTSRGCRRRRRDPAGLASAHAGRPGRDAAGRREAPS